MRGLGNFSPKRLVMRKDVLWTWTNVFVHGAGDPYRLLLNILLFALKIILVLLSSSPLLARLSVFVATLEYFQASSSQYTHPFHSSMHISLIQFIFFLNFLYYMN